MGRTRKSNAECARLKAKATTGFHSVHTSRKSERDTARSAAALRALVAIHGTDIALSWARGGMRAFLTGGAEPVARQAILAWERRGWAEYVPSGDVSRSRLVVDLDAVPVAPPPTPL